MAKCLITGATGFIGSHAVPSFVKAGWQVYGLSRDTSRLPSNVIPAFYTGNPSDLIAVLAAIKPDVVVHLATLYIKDHVPGQISELMTANITFGANLLEAMALSGCRRLVTAGTVWQHFESSDDQYSAATLYAATKQAFEDIAHWYAAARGIAVTALHLSDTYGPHDPRPKIFTLLESAAKNGTALELSPGNQEIDPLFVLDAVSALTLAASRKDEGFSIFRISPGKPVTLRTLVDIWCEVYGMRVDLRWGAKPYRQREVMKAWLGGSVLPGWSAITSLASGLEACRMAKCH